MTRAALLAALLLTCVRALAHDPGEIVTIDRARMTVIQAETFAAHDLGGQPVQLPDPWFRRDFKAGTAVWYELRFDMQAPATHSHSLFIPRIVASRVEVYLNGRLLGRHDDYAAPGRVINPLYALLPAHLLREGENELILRMLGTPMWFHGITRAYVGPSRELGTRAGRWRLMQGDVISIFAIAFGLVGVLALACWSVERSEELLWYGAILIAYLAITAAWYLSLPHPITGWTLSLIFLRYAGLVTPFAILQLRLAGWRVPWLEWTLWVVLAGSMLSLVNASWHWRPHLWLWFGLFYAVLPLLALAVLARPRADLKRFSRLLLALAALVATGFSLHDYAVRAGLLDFERAWLAHYVPPFFLIAGGAVIFERFLAATRRQRELAVELEARVAQKSREIEAAHAQMRAADEERALVRERRRIMADMHDGLGSRLVGLLSQVQSGKADARQLEEGLTAALEELRTTIDSLQPVEGDLSVVLGNVRHRMRSVFDTAGVELGWRVGELPRLDDLTPARNLAIQRILLELFTNVLKHSGARKVEVTTSAGAGKASIMIEDDGRGFVVGSPVNGHGLRNLQERACEAGGTLVIESEPGRGTRATLALPAAA
ncbi:MAG TPA: ATP-binding protein [Burkholderiales bacterium]|nr:ATP-binding protein [Burkholderiales bacterium]